MEQMIARLIQAYLDEHLEPLVEKVIAKKIIEENERAFKRELDIIVDQSGMDNNTYRLRATLPVDPKTIDDLEEL